MSGTAQEILKLGQHYLQTVGFNGFSFQDIANDLKIQKPSLYYHFKSKEEMGVALIEGYKDAFEEWAKSRQDYPTAAKLKSYFKLFLYLYQNNDSKICPIGALCVDYHTLPKAMQKALKAFHQTQKDWLHKILSVGKKEKVFFLDHSPELVADLILSQTQGVLQLSRLSGNDKLLKDMSDYWLKTLLKNEKDRR